MGKGVTPPVETSSRRGSILKEGLTILIVISNTGHIVNSGHWFSHIVYLEHFQVIRELFSNNSWNNSQKRKVILEKMNS